MPISIIIPTKDRHSALERAVASAVAALPTGGQVIVVDDGSKVPATDALKRRGVTVAQNEGPGVGPSAARNQGAKLAQMPLLLFLDDDDELMPDYPARVVTVARNRPDVDFGNVAQVRRKPGREDKVAPRDRRPGRRDATSSFASRLCGAGGLWIRRDTFLEVGGFDEDLPIYEDHELCMRLAKSGAAMWFDDQVGYVIHARADARDAERVSRGTSAADRLKCFEKIMLAHGELIAAQGFKVRLRYFVRGWKGRFSAWMGAGGTMT